MSSYLRPDEKAAAADIEKSKRHDAALKSGLKTAGSIAATAGGLAITSRILPFLNDLIPTDLAIKGISKISPKIGDYLKRGIESGLSIKDGLNFLKKQAMPKEEENENYPGEKKSNEMLAGLAGMQQKLNNLGQQPQAQQVQPQQKMQQQPQNSIANDVMNPPGSMPTKPPSAELQAAMQGNPADKQQLKQQLLQAMQILSQKLKT